MKEPVDKFMHNAKCQTYLTRKGDEVDLYRLRVALSFHTRILRLARDIETEQEETSSSKEARQPNLFGQHLHAATAQVVANQVRMLACLEPHQKNLDQLQQDALMYVQHQQTSCTWLFI